MKKYSYLTISSLRDNQIFLLWKKQVGFACIVLFLAACQAREVGLQTQLFAGGMTPTLYSTQTATQTLSITPKETIQPFTKTTHHPSEPSPLPTKVSTSTPTPTVTPDYPSGPLPTIGAENGWITYRNEIGGYEIRIPQEARISAHEPLSWNNSAGLSEAEIQELRHRYGNRLCVFIEYQNGWVSIESYQLNDLKLDCASGGIGDYQPTSKEETLTIAGVSYQAKGTVWTKNNAGIFEMMSLRFPNGTRIVFGSSSNNPEEYQAYLQNAQRTLIQIIESYSPIPLPTSISELTTVANKANGKRRVIGLICCGGPQMEPAWSLTV